MKLSRVSLSLAVAAASMLFANGCVPYAEHIRTENELIRVTEINGDLERHMKEYEVLLAKSKGSQDYDSARVKELLAKLDSCENQRSALEAAKEELLARINSLGELQLGHVPFTEEEIASISNGQMTEEGSLILPAGLLFSSGSAKLATAAKSSLRDLTRVLADHPNEVLMIKGHTDRDPIKASGKLFKDNWDLGLKRAHAVFSELDGMGIERTSMRIFSAGYAEPPKDINPQATDSATKEKMRRVELWLVPITNTK